MRLSMRGRMRDLKLPRLPRGAGAVAVVAVLLAATPARAADIDVDSTADTVADDGTCSLREAVTAANDDSPSGARTGECEAGAGADRVVVPAGTYTLTRAGARENDNETGDLDLSSDVTVVGSGAAVTTVDADQIDRALDVVSGDAVIEKATITNGLSPDGLDEVVDSKGAQVAPATSGEPGGGIRARAVLTLTDVVVTGNATGRGGAEAADVSPDCLLGISGDGGEGGGVAAENAQLTISRSTVEGNTTGIGGSVVEGGACGDAGAGGNGGGIATRGGAVSVFASTIAHNQAGDGGETVPPGDSGGRNGQGGPGGGLSSSSGTVTIANTTIAANEAGDSPSRIDDINFGGGPGGGLYVAAESLALSHVTLAQNQSGGGLDGDEADGFEVAVGAASAEVRNTLIVNTSNENDAACFGLPDPPNAHNLSFAPGMPGCPGASAIDPGLGPLQDNGGPTETMAIPPGSIAVDAIPSTGADCLPTDQRGISRPQGTACDVGAFEAEPPPMGASPEQPSGATPVTGETPAPKLSGGTKLDLQGRSVLVALTCAGPATCEGTVALRRLGSKGNSQPGYGRAARGRALGSSAYSIGAGETGKVRVKLTRKATDRIRRQGRVKARLLIEPSSGARSEQRVRIRAGRT